MFRTALTQKPLLTCYVACPENQASFFTKLLDLIKKNFAEDKFEFLEECIGEIAELPTEKQADLLAAFVHNESFFRPAEERATAFSRLRDAACELPEAGKEKLLHLISVSELEVSSSHYWSDTSGC